MKNEEKIKLFLLVCLINLCEFSINERIFFFFKFSTGEYWSKNLWLLNIYMDLLF